jgi:cytochrome c
VTRLLACAFCAALSLLAALTPALAAQEAGDTQAAFNNSCRTCHSMKEGDNRLGPTLNGVIGRKAGTVGGFQFSSSMKGSGIVWDEATLDKFIANPEAVVHGNRMKPFGGIESAEQRSKIIAFLKSISGR